MSAVEAVLTAWAWLDALLLTAALAVLAYERRDDPDRHRFHLEDA